MYHVFSWVLLPTYISLLISQEKIEIYLSSSKQDKALVLLRQLKFVETTLFHNGNPYYDQSSPTSTTPTTTTISDDSSETTSSTTALAIDAEIILLDML